MNKKSGLEKWIISGIIVAFAVWFFTQTGDKITGAVISEVSEKIENFVGGDGCEKVVEEAANNLRKEFPANDIELIQYRRFDRAEDAKDYVLTWNEEKTNNVKGALQDLQENSAERIGVGIIKVERGLTRVMVLGELIVNYPVVCADGEILTGSRYVVEHKIRNDLI